MLQLGKITSHRHWMFQHPSQHQKGVPATHRGKEKFLIPTEYCHQPSIEARKK